MITVVKLPSASLSATPNQTTQATPSDPGSPLGMQMFAITSAGSNGTSSVRHNYQYKVTIQERCGAWNFGVVEKPITFALGISVGL
jgi:hypothetical protein